MFKANICASVFRSGLFILSHRQYGHTRRQEIFATQVTQVESTEFNKDMKVQYLQTLYVVSI